MVDGPAIRNSWTKAAVRRTRAFPPDKKAAFLARVPADTLDRIRDLGNADWLSLDDTLPVLDALHAALADDEEFVEYWRELIFDSYAGGLFSQLIKKAATLGGDGKRLLKLAPQAWALSTTKCGVVDVARDEDGSLSLRSQGFPTSILESKPFALLFKGALLGMIEFVGGEGVVDYQPVRDDAGVVEAIAFSVR